MSHAALRFEVLGATHDRAGFSCGVEALDGWFRTRASQDQRRNVAQVFVGVEEEEVVGFYSLSMFTLELDTLPAALLRRLPRYAAIPAAVIGRLGCATRLQGTGLGRLLLADAIQRVLSATATIAAYAVVVDAKDENGKRFCEAHGFIPLVTMPRRLFLLTETARQANRAR